MQRHYSPIVPVNAVGLSTVLLPSPIGDTSASSAQVAPQASTSALDGSATQGASAAAPAPADVARVQKYMEATLKNTGFKAEITNERNGYTVLKLVDADTGKVVLQMPNQVVLAILATLDQHEAQDAARSSEPATGTVLDQIA